MKLHNLKPAKGSVKTSKRIGRGQGSGKGGTSTRGHKGAQSRSGYSHRWGFEGGQMPIHMRLPKRGFKNINRVAYTALNLDRLQEIADAHKVKEISIEFLRSNNIISRTELVKILGRGELKTALKINVHAASKSAQEAIEKAGGSLELIQHAVETDKKVEDKKAKPAKEAKKVAVVAEEEE